MGKFVDFVRVNYELGSLREQFVRGAKVLDDLPEDNNECRKEIETAIQIYFALKYNK